MTHQIHTYHIVNPSPWPLTGALSALLITSGLIIWFHFNSIFLLSLGLITNILTIFQWWRDIIREGTFQGHHTPTVQKGLRYGIILFIISEVLFFTGFFWAFYHSSLVPTTELGGYWPPAGINPLNPLEVPLLNTAVLLASGVSVTWAHHSILEKNRTNAIQALIITISLGLYFTLLQIIEYNETSFTIADSVYGSTFFIATGFHGFHVIIGSSFLFICLIRQLKFHFTSNHHFGFEAAAWYWHFVDVVWLFLYVSIYWWGSYPFSMHITVQLTSNQLDSIFFRERVITIIIIILSNSTLAIVLVIIAFTLPQLNAHVEKISPYECGFDPLGSARLPFSIKFFLVAITFLLFDLEIALLLPIPWLINSPNTTISIIIVLILIIALASSLAYEWIKEGLEWNE